MISTWLSQPSLFVCYLSGRLCPLPGPGTPPLARFVRSWVKILFPASSWLWSLWPGKRLNRQCRISVWPDTDSLSPCPSGGGCVSLIMMKVMVEIGVFKLKWWWWPPAWRGSHQDWWLMSLSLSTHHQDDGLTWKFVDLNCGCQLLLLEWWLSFITIPIFILILMIMIGHPSASSMSSMSSSPRSSVFCNTMYIYHIGWSAEISFYFVNYIPLKNIKTEAAITEMSQTRQLYLRTCSTLLYLWTNEFLETNYIFTQLFSGWENQILPKEKSNIVKNCKSRDEKCKCLNFYWLNPLLDIWWDWYVVMLAGPILSCQSFALVGYLGQAWILWEYWSRKFAKNEKNGVWQKILPSPHHQVWWVDQDYWGGLISSRLTTPITLWLIARMFFSPFI